MDAPSLAVACEGADFVMFQRQTAGGATAGGGLAKDRLQILAVTVAGDEGLVRFRDAGLREPVDEVRGLLHESAHIGGADIEQVMGAGGGIGGATPEPRPALDQDHAGTVGRQQEAQGGEHTAKSRADHGDCRSIGHGRSILQTRRGAQS